MINEPRVMVAYMYCLLKALFPVCGEAGKPANDTEGCVPFRRTSALPKASDHPMRLPGSGYL